ncbi:hypothetical protein [Kineococcus rhizosphaerae]|uniref:Uncharacterized protein n=1 Tax=Kineococcus rhizosphaerae TaxID=559628 RepID=A0A2T0R6B6_9ACTN|nr:hypothetical protein [Kineococcus rhizosphaerae]PRY16687.1 hypothetical protein CLV37_103118 [Kineococcus rhizosphaerae]
MESEPHVLSRRGETITLDAEHVGDVHRHSAFSLWDDADDLPDDADPATQVRAVGEPVPVRRGDLDDVARAETEALLSLAGAVDHACLERLLPQVEVDDVAPDALAAWLVGAVQAVNDAAAPTCSLNALLDTELRRYAGIPLINGRYRLLDAGWCDADVQLMSRREEPWYAVVADEHLAGLRGALQVSLTSVDFGPEEYLTASALFAYSPRISLHPGEVRIARVSPRISSQVSA